jgi:aryl-alcohol dehydrogenase-like predicted oxidoreductase
MAISRRVFLGSAAVGAAAKSAMPTRVLGRTGERVSILAFGGGSRFLMYPNEDQSMAALTRALDLGVTYVDSAMSYGKHGESETLIGKVLKGRRKGIFLATKVDPRKGEEAMRAIEGSLRRLQMDQVDLIHVHALGDERDLAAAEAADGVIPLLHKLRDQKVTRFIGVSCHAYPAVLRTALERYDFDVTQMALNAARMGMAKPRPGEEKLDRLEHSFETVALPVALRKKMGVIAMKIFAQEKLLGGASVQQLIHYSMSLPVTAVVLGMPKLEHVEENIGLAKSFRRMPEGEMRGLSRRLAAAQKASLDRFFVGHRDG